MLTGQNFRHFFTAVQQAEERKKSRGEHVIRFAAMECFWERRQIEKVGDDKVKEGGTCFHEQVAQKPEER